MESLTVSLELLAAQAKRPLGLKIEAVMERWVAKRALGTFYESKDLEELSKIVETETGMLVDFRILDIPLLNASASVIRIPGHQGTSYHGVNTKPTTLAGSSVPTELRKLKIDLDRGYVNGGYLKDFRNRITLYSGLITHPQVVLTAEEVTAATLHELGHCFNQYLTLGEYVWLNYILQDGLDVLYGKKPNVYKLEVLTEKGLERYCKDKNLLNEIKTSPTEANLRRAILTSYVEAPRHHLSSGSNTTSLKREEQMADLFASRMGYARASVTAQVKADKYDGTRFTMTSSRFAVGEALKLTSALGAVFTGFVGLAMPLLLMPALGFYVVNRIVDFSEGTTYYDSPLERLNKLRRDLVAQLKVLSKDPDTEKRIIDDIKVIDNLIVDYKQRTTIWELTTTLLSPYHRRQRHQRAKEEQLERLLNNDLFVNASKLNTLVRNV